MELTHTVVKSLLLGTNLKRAVDREWIASYVHSLLVPWNSKWILATFVEEVRAYRRDHKFYDFV